MRADHDHDNISLLPSYTVISSLSWSLWLHTLVYWTLGQDPPNDPHWVMKYLIKSVTTLFIGGLKLIQAMCTTISHIISIYDRHPTPFISYPGHTHLHAHAQPTASMIWGGGMPLSHFLPKRHVLEFPLGRVRGGPLTRAHSNHLVCHMHRWIHMHALVRPPPPSRSLSHTRAHTHTQSYLISQWRCDRIWQYGSGKIVPGLR